MEQAQCRMSCCQEREEQREHTVGICNIALVEIKSLHDEWCALDGRRCTCSWAFLISFTLASVRSFTLVTCPKRTPSTLFCCSPSKVDAHHYHQARLEDAGDWVPTTVLAAGYAASQIVQTSVRSKLRQVRAQISTTVLVQVSVGIIACTSMHGE